MSSFTEGAGHDTLDRGAGRGAGTPLAAPPGGATRGVAAAGRHRLAAAWGRGGDVARRLAADLGLDLFDREIIQRIAESTHLSERVVSSLREGPGDADGLAGLVLQPQLPEPGEYRYHLSRVVGALAHHGGAVILGRGAHFILGQGEALRVLLVAPLETRIRTVMEREGLGEREARRRIVSVEADRKAFLMKHFHADFADPTTFDIVANTAVLGIDGVCAAIRATLERRGPVGRSRDRPLIPTSAGTFYKRALPAPYGPIPTPTSSRAKRRVEAAAARGRPGTPLPGRVACRLWAYNGLNPFHESRPRAGRDRGRR